LDERYEINNAMLGQNCAFWVITKRVVAAYCRRFGFTYRTHTQR